MGRLLHLMSASTHPFLPGGGVEGFAGGLLPRFGPEGLPVLLGPLGGALDFAIQIAILE